MGQVVEVSMLCRTKIGSPKEMEARRALVQTLSSFLTEMAQASMKPPPRNRRRETATSPTPHFPSQVGSATTPTPHLTSPPRWGVPLALPLTSLPLAFPRALSVALAVPATPPRTPR